MHLVAAYDAAETTWTAGMSDVGNRQAIPANAAGFRAHNLGGLRDGYLFFNHKHATAHAHLLQGG
jgi:hypothetical protein